MFTLDQLIDEVPDRCRQIIIFHRLVAQVEDQAARLGEPLPCQVDRPIEMALKPRSPRKAPNSREAS